MMEETGTDIPVDNLLKLRMSELSKAKSTLDAMSVSLKEHGVGMDDPLVDSEGFPRADIDIYAIRQARQSIIRAKNDVKGLVSEIQELLNAKMPAQQESMICDPTNDSGGDRVQKPLCIVQSVTQGSPADRSGLSKDDIVIQIGNLTGESFRSLHDINTIVKDNEDTYIKVVVLRNGISKRLNLKPAKWSGPGLLGCHLVNVKP